MMTIKEEIEQNQIEKSVMVDLDKRITSARLPVLYQPALKLHPNRDKALKVLNQQIKKLTRYEEDKLDVLKSEKKLQEMGHVDYVRNLSPELQKSLFDNPVKNYIPWRAVWKESSLSTPCRMVFDASQPTESGFSLNDILAKGRNNMNKLVEIFIR